MKKIFKNKLLSIILIMALMVGILGGVSVFIDDLNDDVSNDDSSNDTQYESFSPEDNNSGNSAGVVDFSKLTYVALGDSITYGFDSTRGGLQMEKPYPALVGELLSLKSVYNYGISGSTLTSLDSTRHPVLNRYSSMTNNADIVSVMIGINDYMIGAADLGTIDSTDANTIYGALNQLASGLKSKYPDAYIFFMTPYKCARAPGVCAKGYSLEDVVKAIKEVCLKHNIDVLDMYSEGQYELEMNLSSNDGIHPSQSFFIEYTAPQIAAFIKSNYK